MHTSEFSVVIVDKSIFLLFSAFYALVMIMFEDKVNYANFYTIFTLNTIIDIAM